MEPCTEEPEAASPLPQHWRDTRLMVPDVWALMPHEQQPQDIRITLLKCRDGPPGEVWTKRTGDLPRRPLWAALLLEAD
jgi:hypothetical protein